MRTREKKLPTSSKISGGAHRFHDSLTLTSFIQPFQQILRLLLPFPPFKHYGATRDHNHEIAQVVITSRKIISRNDKWQKMCTFKMPFAFILNFAINISFA